MSKNLDSIFDNITDEEFKQFLKDCNFKYEKVERGQGGLFIEGKRVTLEELDYNRFLNRDRIIKSDIDIDFELTDKDDIKKKIDALQMASYVGMDDYAKYNSK